MEEEVDQIESGWMPIETAPRGEFVLVCGSKRMGFPSVARCMKYETGIEWTIETCSSVETIYPPKYWMPLPNMPPGASNAE